MIKTICIVAIQEKESPSLSVVQAHTLLLRYHFDVLFWQLCNYISSSIIRFSVHTLTEREIYNCSGFQDKIFILMLFLLLYENSCSEVSESQ